MPAARITRAPIQLSGRPYADVLRDLTEAGARRLDSVPPAGSTGWTLARPGPAPLVSQHQGLALDASNCGPTSFVMVARAFGRLENLSDEAAIRWADSVGQVQEFGALPQNFAAMADASSPPLAYEQRSGVAPEKLAKQLEAGGQALLVGINAFALPWNRRAGFAAHTVAIVGYESGRFRVHDPDPPGGQLVPHFLTPQELEQVVARSVNPKLGKNLAMTMSLFDVRGVGLTRS